MDNLQYRKLRRLVFFDEQQAGSSSAEVSSIDSEDVDSVVSFEQCSARKPTANIQKHAGRRSGRRIDQQSVKFAGFLSFGA